MDFERTLPASRPPSGNGLAAQDDDRIGGFCNLYVRTIFAWGG